MQGHVYTASFTGVAVTALQDLFELLAAAGVPAIIHEIRIGQSSDAGDAEAEMLQIQVSRTDGTTSGSGGTTPTPQDHSPASPAASTTVEANNTTQATVATPIISDTFNVQAGWLYVPTPEERIIIPGGGTVVVELPSAPNDSLTMSGSITFEEIK